MTSPIEPRTASLYHASLRETALEPAIGAAIVLAAIASYLVLPAVVPRGAGFLVAQATLLVVPIGGVLALRVPRPLAALGLRGARPALWLAAIAVGTTLWYVNARLVALLPLPSAQTHRLEALVDDTSRAGALATFALVPALCEELVFRGVLARSLGRVLKPVAAAALSALVFALFHLSIVQALPTLTLGFALAVITLRADAIGPAVVAHALNNAIAVVLSRHDRPAIGGALDAHPTLALIGCAVVSAAGLVTAARAPRA